MARTVNDLIEHLKKYKDAVIIVGPGILSNKPDYDIEEFNSKYNRRNLVRNPDVLWEFFIKDMYKAIDTKDIKAFLSVANLIGTMNDCVSLVIDQNINTPNLDKCIKLHGSVHEFICPKCKIIYTGEYVFSKEPYEAECECCGGVIRPTALLSGERYDNKDFLEVQNKIKESHTVILIGMDYTEESLMSLIAEYGDVKAFINEAGEEEKILVSVQSPDEEFDPNEMTFFEFLVKDDIESALTRLTGAF